MLRAASALKRIGVHWTPQNAFFESCGQNNKEDSSGEDNSAEIKDARLLTYHLLDGIHEMRAKTPD